MNSLTIALILGGDSSEREVSLESGRQVHDALDKNRYHVLRYDPSSDLGKLVSDAPLIDFALIILHGPLGEDGTIQGLLDLLDIPYQGSGILGSALAMNKLAAKKLYEKEALPIPAYLALQKGKAMATQDVIKRLGLPLFVKPASGGSSIGMSLVKAPDALPGAVETAHSQCPVALVETYIKGTELTCAVVGNDNLEAYPVVEIRPGEAHDFFDFTAKYTPGETSEICPAAIPGKVAVRIQDAAKRAHGALHCRGYSRSDFILDNDRIFLIETNTIPGMTRTSLLPQAAAAAGVGFSSLLDRLIYLGLENFMMKGAFRDRERLRRIEGAFPSLSKE